MPQEKLEFELQRLRAELNKIRQDEVFGGLSAVQLAEYNRKSDRVYDLEFELHVIAFARKSLVTAKEEPERPWDKDPETDTPQAAPRQPYRSREKDSTDSSTDSSRQAEPKKAPEDKGGE